MIKQIDSNGASLSVEDVGEGPSIVLVHGWSMSGRFFRRQIEGLAGTHRVVIPDLRGHGASEKVTSGHTMPSYAADVHAVVEALELERPVLVGWSMGAFVAFEYVRAFGADGVAGMVIVDQPPSDYAWDDYELGAFTVTDLRDAIADIQTDQRGFVESFAPLMLQTPDPDTISWMTNEMLRVPPTIACTALVDQTLRDYRTFLQELTVPTLILFGEDDKLMSPRGGKFIANLVAGSRLHLFGRSSHCPFLEEPSKFDDLLTEFVAEANSYESPQ